MSLNLLQKTELWINGVTLAQANLTDLAQAVADTLALPADQVLVVDVRPGTVTLDILAREVAAENIIGKDKALLEAVASIPGVTLDAEAHIHSNGILGLICADSALSGELLTTVASMEADVRGKVARRAMVFSSGFELQQKLIEDTNAPYLKAALEKRGYAVTIGNILADDIDVIQDSLEDALSRGFGLIITTGGVGAEDKDHTVEALCRIDPKAACPYIVKFTKGTGRHVKDGVKIGVGSEGLSLMVTLPGPHDEVVAASEVLFRGLEEGWDKSFLADQLAGVLADKWRHGHHSEHHGHCAGGHHHK